MTDAINMTVPEPLKMARYELNDLGNARRLKDLARGRLLWVEDFWMAYDGRRWTREDGKRLAQKLAQDVAQHIEQEAAELVADMKAQADLDDARKQRIKDRSQELLKHAIASGNASKAEGMLKAAQSLIFANRDDFDRDPLVLNVANGTLRFRKDGAGKWAVVSAPHDPVDMISRLANVTFDPKAKSPTWQGHIETVLPIEGVRAFFQQAIGYAATGEITEQSIFILQGKGGDGKSTTMNLLRELLGNYGSNADVQTFMVGAQRSGGEASPDMARLGGDVRLVSTGEPRPGGALDEGRIKAITGGAAITVRELHGAPFEYVPRFKVFFECNRKPRISGDDDGIWRRVQLIEFPHQFKGEKADKRFFHRLREEAPGVLNWVLEGALAWLTAGVLVPPPEVQAAVDDYRKAANPFGEWFAEAVDTSDPSARTPAADLYGSYKSWCEDNAVGDRDLMSSTAFGRALSDKQIPKMKGSNGRILRRGAQFKPGMGTGGSEAQPVWEAPGAPVGAPPADLGAGDWSPDDLPPGW